MCTTAVQFLRPPVVIVGAVSQTYLVTCILGPNIDTKSWVEMAPTIKSGYETRKVLTASITADKIPLFLRNKLHPLLPYSLPLYRRCQFFLYQLSLERHTAESVSKSSGPELWIALSQLASDTDNAPTDDWLDSWLVQAQPLSRTNRGDDGPSMDWLSCHIDLHEPGQTQVWTFGSWEATVTPVPMSSSTSATTPIIPSAQQVSLGRALFHHLRTNHTPYLPMTPSEQYLTMKASGKIVSSPYKRSKILFGAIAETSWWLLDDDVVRSTPKASDSRSIATATSRSDKPFLKYILPLATTPTTLKSLPRDLTIRPLPQAALQTVLDRSAIPRTLELLLSLPTIGIFPSSSTNEAAISWGILAKDASLSSLHTEPEYRGRGLAEVVSWELVRVTKDRFRSDWLDVEVGERKAQSDGVGYAHIDVSPDNMASRRVFEKMGAKVGWKVGWIEVDVEFDIDINGT